MWSAWGPWNHCSKTCGDGTKERFRSCSDPTPQYGGDDCLGTETESDHCNIQPCPSKICFFLYVLS